MINSSVNNREYLNQNVRYCILIGTKRINNPCYLLIHKVRLIYENILLSTVSLGKRTCAISSLDNFLSCISLKGFYCSRKSQKCG